MRNFPTTKTEAKILLSRSKRELSELEEELRSRPDDIEEHLSLIADKLAHREVFGQIVVRWDSKELEPVLFEDTDNCIENLKCRILDELNEYYQHCLEHWDEGDSFLHLIPVDEE